MTESTRINWRDSVESTGEVSAVTVAESIGISVDDVLAQAEIGHGARYVGGISKYLIWREDAERIEKAVS